MTELYLTICKHSVDRRLVACRLCDRIDAEERLGVAAQRLIDMDTVNAALRESLSDAYAIIAEGGWRQRYYGDPDLWWRWDQWCDRLGLERQATDVESSKAPRADPDLLTAPVVLTDISGQARA